MPHAKAIEFNGNRYKSLRFACKQLNVERSTVLNRLKAGIPLEQALDPSFTMRRYLPIVVEGKKFESKKLVCRHYNVSYDRFLGRQELGWGIEEALELVPKINRNNKNDYSKRIQRFAEQEFTTVKSVETRLSVRRKRFRKWLEVKNIDQYANRNAQHMVDENGKWYYSITEAAKVLNVRRTRVKNYLQETNIDLIYGQKLKLDSEMQVSFETLFLLMSHKNVIQRELGPERIGEIRLDHNVVMQFEITLKNSEHEDCYHSILKCADVSLIELEITKGTLEIIKVKSILIGQDERHTEAKKSFSRGCCHAGELGSREQLIEECHKLKINV
jgi:hypothetical protein